MFSIVFHAKPCFVIKRNWGRMRVDSGCCIRNDWWIAKTTVWYSFWVWTRIIAQKQTHCCLCELCDTPSSCELNTRRARRLNHDQASAVFIPIMLSSERYDWLHFAFVTFYEMKIRLLQVLLSHLVDAPVGLVSESATMSSLLEFIVRTDYASNTCKYNSTSIFCNVICDICSTARARGRKKRTEKISCVRRMDIVAVDIHTSLSCHDSARKTQN